MNFIQTPTESNSRTSDAVANLFPGYFALVMATGIVSISAHLLEMTATSWPLLYINIVAYLVLVLLLLVRIVRFFPRVLADIGDHVRGPGFFTLVAGTCMLGSQLVIVAGQYGAAAVLWFVGLVLWAVPTQFTTYPRRTSQTTPTEAAIATKMPSWRHPHPC